MSFFFSNAQAAPQVTALQIQKSAYGVCWPVVFGQTRIAFSLLWEANFKSSGGAGKGKFG